MPRVDAWCQVHRTRRLDVLVPQRDDVPELGKQLHGARLAGDHGVVEHLGGGRGQGQKERVGREA